MILSVPVSLAEMIISWQKLFQNWRLQDEWHNWLEAWINLKSNLLKAIYNFHIYNIQYNEIFKSFLDFSSFSLKI